MFFRPRQLCPRANNTHNLLNTRLDGPRSRSVRSREETGVFFGDRSVLKITNYNSDNTDVPGTIILYGAGKLTLTIACGVTPIHSAHVFGWTRLKDTNTCYAESVGAMMFWDVSPSVFYTRIVHIHMHNKWVII